MSESNAALNGLARRLVNDQVLTEAQAIQATQAARQANQSLLHYLSGNKEINGQLLALAVAEEFGLPFLDLSAFDFEQLPKEIVNEKLIRQHQVLPLLKRGNRLYVAVSNPTNLSALDEIQFQTGLMVQAIIVAEDILHTLVSRFLEGEEEALGDLESEELENLEVDNQDEGGNLTENTASTDDAPIVRFVNKILLDAIKRGASDIHFEPYEKHYRIRFRTDGILHEVTRPPSNLRARLSARLKVMARLNLSERRIPQDGSIKLKVSKTRSIDFRVNTLPTLWGEKIVLRVLDPAAAKLGVDQLGFDSAQKKLFLETLEQPQGMLLVTGPTGSGKTVTLYTGLNLLNTSERNISTAEDPVELNVDGINQVNVNPKVGLDFATALRAFLRQDPDIVMVGEIRDLETAEISIKAAQTGHLVLSTLHTNSAAETLNRLMNMGIASFNIATSVSLIVAQRLARRLCEHCKKPADHPKHALLEAGFSEAQLAKAQIYRPIGCEKCTQGYKGRVGIYEVVKITPKLSRAIMESANALELSQLARAEGFPDLRAVGLNKVLQGLTSLEEVNRVTLD
ncbi:type IV pilus assembly protein PilB [Allopseudospirillum japonicum]|uniref:Type IV pilus assembly protein PilB n=1 Tax=Allopseudospirillum japonicum TaxID=64971 RepID=A0A1H6QQA2_9GAMM|nr:type IV-A pilus assembly ATPase PilB [Allopseudospirillum japonicum]SEI41152.1 type IV pilus assembly protein PilB [Allopseudospirillum japonicum]